MDNKNNQKPQKPKTLEVLSCTAEFYIAMQGKGITAYTAIQVKCDYTLNFVALPLENLGEIAKRLGCEVVTDVRQIETGANYSTIIGTGLIPKKEEP